ncbi:MAG TPA: serine/threonine-protein kinase [Polyangiaceae bacterium]|nr:serine/threonine-protein kinase [Polyangiaceae bacterium]
MFPQIFGKYVLEREIAAGGMARVLLATLRGAGGFEKRLVVKQIRPELASDQSFIGRFVAEAKTAVELSHANIVPVYELGVEQGTYYIAMEFCAGVALSQLLVQGALSPAEGAYIGVEICRALDYAHRKAGIVHRDVTPRNVMIDPEGMVRLIDFGIAAPVDLAAADPAGPRAREPLFGSAGHMPPEQLRHGPLTPAADVFAVAALLIEIWSGKPPFRRDTFEASLRALREPPPDLAQLDPELAPLAPLLRSALALEPGERPQTAEELARPLREFLRSSDLGDIARRLGERVSARLTRPPDAARLPARDPSLRASGSGATQTFAARDALLEWTAKIDSQPPAPAASAISGVVIESGSLPPRSRANAARGPGLYLARRRWLTALSGAAALALGALWLVQRDDAPPLSGASLQRPRDGAPAQQPAPAAPGQSMPVPVATLPAPPVTAPANAAPATVAVPAATVVAPPAPARAPARSAGATPAEARKPGADVPGPASGARTHTQVQLTAEPRALVLVDGVAAGRTPLSLSSLTPGQHSFVFKSELLGEKLETQLNLRDGGRQRVHADFTSATPQVYLR